MMIRTQVYLEVQQKRLIARMARKRRVAKAIIIRELLDEALANHWRTV